MIKKTKARSEKVPGLLYSSKHTIPHEAAITRAKTNFNYKAADRSSRELGNESKVANRPGMSGTVPELTSGVRCPGLGHFRPGSYWQLCLSESWL